MICKYFSFLLMGIFICSSCNNKIEKNTDKQILSLQWIIGEWSGEIDGNIFIEKWEKNDDSTYKGIGLFISKNDTSKEQLTLALRNNQLYYIPRVENQNGNEEIPFKLTKSIGNNQWIFENKEHDFPQKINYTKVNDKKFIALISGENKGKIISRKFTFQKLK